MRILVNTCFLDLIPGSSLYYQKLFEQLVSICPQHQFVFYTDQIHESEPWQLPGVEWHNLKWTPARSRWKLRWQQFRLGRLLKAENGNLFINCFGITQPDVQMPVILLLHPIIFSAEKDGKNPGFLKRDWKAILGKAIKTAVKVGIPNESLRPDAQTLMGVEPSQIFVTGIGPANKREPLNWQQKEKLKEQFSDGREFFFCATQPNNTSQFVLLLRAFSQFKKRQQSNLQLLLRGAEHKEWQAKLSNYKYRSDVRLIPNSEIQHAHLLLAAAYAVIELYASSGSFEICLQAMQCRVPLIADKASGVEAWTGSEEAMLPVDASSAESIAGQMMLIYKDEHLRHRLVENAAQKMTGYNWQIAAQNLASELKSLLGAG